MKGFFKVQTPEQLYEKMDRFKPLSSEKARIEQSLHRISAPEIEGETGIHSRRCPGYERIREIPDSRVFQRSLICVEDEDAPEV